MTKQPFVSPNFRKKTQVSWNKKKSPSHSILHHRCWGRNNNSNNSLTQFRSLKSVSLDSITVQHGSAYTVVRATSYSYGEWQIWGYQNSEIPEPWSQDLVWAMKSSISPCMPKFKVGASRKWLKYHSRVVSSLCVTQILARIMRLNRRSDFDPV